MRKVFVDDMLQFVLYKLFDSSWVGQLQSGLHGHTNSSYNFLQTFFAFANNEEVAAAAICNNNNIEKEKKKKKCKKRMG